MNATLQRARIVSCPHGGKHNGIEGYIADTYADGTSGIDMGFNHVCITSDFEVLEPLQREDVHPTDEVRIDVVLDRTPKRRGRPPKTPSPTPANVPSPIKRPGRPARGSSMEAQASMVGNGVQSRDKSKLQAETSLTISLRGDQHFDISYSNGDTSVEATNVSLSDLERMVAVARSMGGSHEA